MLSFSPSGMLRRAIRSAAQHLRQDRARRGRPPQTRPALAEALEPRQLLTVAIYSNGEPTVNEGTTYYPVISASGDDDEIVYDLTVDWGQGAIQYDGSTAYPAIPCPDGPEDHTINVTCNFGPGTNTHSLTSSPVSASFDYHVENVPPTLTVTSGPDIDQGETYSFSVAFTDPGEDGITNFTIDWGDGTTESYDGGYGRNSSAEFSHQYLDAGDYAIGITATDEDGSYATGDNVDVWSLPAPTDLTGTLDGATNKVKLTWAYSPGNPDGFDIWRKRHDAPETDWELIGTAGPTARSYTDTLPSDYIGNTYDYNVTAVHGPVDSPSGTTEAAGAFLLSVQFGGPGLQEILRDQDGTAYSGAQWYDANGDGSIDGPTVAPYPYGNGTIDGTIEHVFPVSYTRSSSAGDTHLRATLTVPYTGTVGYNWLVKGETSGYTFDPVAVSDGGGGLSATLEAWESLPQAIRDTEIDIIWKLSTDGGANYFTVGESKNRLYVTGRSTPSSYYETVLDVGCGAADRVNMRDGSYLAYDQRTAVDHIWGKFSSLDITRVDGTPMTYWGTHAGPNSSATDLWDTAGLLRNADGRCGAWADFLVNTLAAQGIASHVVGVQVHPLTVALPPQTSDTPPDTPSGGWVRYEGMVIDVNRPAQNTPSPWRYFPDHALVAIDVYADVLYDPSYGSRFSGPTAEQDWQDAAISGFCYEYSVHYADGTFRLAVGSLWVAHDDGANNVY